MKSYVASPSTIERKWYVVDATGPVSYTHLDVYKRQSQVRD